MRSFAFILLIYLVSPQAHAFLGLGKYFNFEPSCKIGTYSFPEHFINDLRAEDIIEDSRTSPLNEAVILKNFEDYSEDRRVFHTEQMGETYSFHIVTEKMGLSNISALVKIETAIRKRVPRGFLNKDGGGYVSGKILRPELSNLAVSEGDTVSTLYECNLSCFKRIK